ncbi:MAG TPA: hypothetical protein PKO24_07355, partial [Methanomassiliicoccales archaeon]|nr:hypothetical protein [Methanomassiliicoccales archaeon]
GEQALHRHVRADDRGEVLLRPEGRALPGSLKSSDIEVGPQLHPHYSFLLKMSDSDGALLTINNTIFKKVLSNTIFYIVLLIGGLP